MCVCGLVRQRAPLVMFVVVTAARNQSFTTPPVILSPTALFISNLAQILPAEADRQSRKFGVKNSNIKKIYIGMRLFERDLQ